MEFKLGHITNFISVHKDKQHFMNFLKRWYLYNFWTLAGLVGCIWIFADHPFDTKDWITIGIFLLIPVAAPIGFFFSIFLPGGMSESNSSNTKNNKITGTNKRKPQTGNSVSKSGLLGLAVGALAYNKARRLSNPPAVWVEDCFLDSHAEVVSVRPKGKRWLMTARIRPPGMPNYVTETYTIRENDQGFSMSGIRFGVKWS